MGWYQRNGGWRLRVAQWIVDVLLNRRYTECPNCEERHRTWRVDLAWDVCDS